MKGLVIRYLLSLTHFTTEFIPLSHIPSKVTRIMTNLLSRKTVFLGRVSPTVQPSLDGLPCEAVFHDIMMCCLQDTTQVVLGKVLTPLTV